MPTKSNSKTSRRPKGTPAVERESRNCRRRARRVSLNTLEREIIRAIYTYSYHPEVPEEIYHLLAEACRLFNSGIQGGPEIPFIEALIAAMEGVKAEKEETLFPRFLNVSTGKGPYFYNPKDFR